MANKKSFDAKEETYNKLFSNDEAAGPGLPASVPGQPSPGRPPGQAPVPGSQGSPSPRKVKANAPADDLDMASDEVKEMLRAIYKKMVEDGEAGPPFRKPFQKPERKRLSFMVRKDVKEFYEREAMRQNKSMTRFVEEDIVWAYKQMLKANRIPRPRPDNLPDDRPEDEYDSDPEE